MAGYFDKRDRIIIPRWRNFKNISRVMDHAPLPTNKLIENPFSSNSFLEEKRAKWAHEKSLGNAWELLSTSYVTDQFQQGVDAALFLKNYGTDLPSHLKRIISKILGDEDIEEIIVPINTEKSINMLYESVSQQIRHLKKQISINPRNGFYWIELARQYMIAGNVLKAERCSLVALELSARSNRFILRASSRLYYHIGDIERAQSIIKNSPNIKNDPLLLAAEISYASKQNRHSKFVKTGFSHVDGGKLANGLISELAVALGTLELRNGSLKSAKKLTRKSLLDPNDNSLAQAKWIARHIPDISVDPWLTSMDLAFEARSFENLYKTQFEQALEEGMDWIIDQPFSKRATHFVSYLCTCFLDKHELAVEVCEFGLKSNPNAFALINNLIFALSSLQKFKMANELMPRLHGAISDLRETIYYLAMEGLLFYKSNEYEKGKDKFEKAINLASSKNEFSELAYLAQANYIKEQFIAKQISYYSASDKLKDLKQKCKSFDSCEQISHIESMVKKAIQQNFIQ